MTLRDTLARVARRDPEAPSLRERAAALRASVARFKRPKVAEAQTQSSDPFNLADCSDPVFAAIEAHTLAYATYIEHPEFGDGTAGDYARSDAEEAAFQALLHTPLTTAEGKIAYALAVIERETGAKASDINRPTHRDDPLPTAYRNLRFGEHAAEVAQTSVTPSPSPQPSHIAQLAAWVVQQRNRINALPDDFDPDEREDMHDMLARYEYELCDAPARTVDDLARKARVVAEHIEDHIRPEHNQYLETRAWLGLRADIERLARGTPIVGTMRELGEGTDEVTRAYPVFSAEDGGQHIDPVFSLIEAARHATRRMQDPYPPVTTFEEGEAEDAESERRHDAQEQAYRAVFRVQPTTREGLFALIDYARERADYHLGLVADIAGAKPMPNAPDVLGTIREGVAMLLDGVPEVVIPDQRREA